MEAQGQEACGDRAYGWTEGESLRAQVVPVPPLDPPPTVVLWWMEKVGSSCLVGVIWGSADQGRGVDLDF